MNNKIVDLPYIEMEVEEDVALVIPRSDRFHEIAHDLGEFIKALPLSNEQNNQLIDLVKKQVLESEETAAKFGFEVGSGFVADEMGLEL